MAERVFMGEVEEIDLLGGIGETASTGDVEDRKLKRKIEEEPSLDEDLEELLTLRLGSGSSKSLKISEDSDSSTPKHDEPLIPQRPDEPLVHQVVQDKNQFSCKLCNKKLPTAQALGGHQNAHKRERGISKWEREMENDPYGFLSDPYLGSYPLSTPNYFLNQRVSPLYQGATLHPMDHMPNTVSWSLGSGGYANQLRLRHPNTNTTAPQFRMTSSWRPPVRFPEIYEELNQIPSLAGSSNTSFSVRSHHQARHSRQENPTVSSRDSSLEELDLTLGLRSLV